MEVQPDLVENTREKSPSRIRGDRGSGYHRAGYVRAGPATAACPQPKKAAAARDDRPNSAYRIGGVCNLSRWHDAAHRHLEERTSVSVLHLLKLRDQRQNSLQRAFDLDGEARHPRHRTSAGASF